jgi:cytochrome b561
MNVSHSLIAILALIVLRFFWRITHPVAPASSLPAWQQLISEAAHWLLDLCI